MDIHVVDGTYELFRHFFAVPSRQDPEGREVGAVRGVVRSIRRMLDADVTHLAVATDHVIESFRNELWPGYKDSEGIEPELLSQFPLLEEALEALGVVVWPMVEFEADDALAAAAAAAASDDRVDRVWVCSPDKDLAQCVRGERVVQLDRRHDRVRNEAAIREKFGVGPESIADWLALVGDSADGFPGLPGFGKKTAATLLARFEHLEEIPDDADLWEVEVRGAARLATTLEEQRDRARLFKELATLRTDAVELDDVERLRWHGPQEAMDGWAERLGSPHLAEPPARTEGHS